MTMNLFHIAPRAAGAAIALSLGLALSACGGMAGNRTIESVHQPVVQRVDYSLDVTTGPGGLSGTEQRRLAGWFEAMNLRYGDKVSIDDPLQSGATRAEVEGLVARHGLLLGADAPVTPGYVNAGTVRVIVSRMKASVPHCPDWSANSDANLGNATSTNYGCAINGNLAAMVANPEHLIKGDAGTGETVVMSSNKAIEAYRTATPTATGGLKDSSTKGGN